MATYEVSSWPELAALATQSVSSKFTSNTLIKLTADIDCNEEIPEGVAETLTFYSNSASYRVTIDGSYDDNGEIKNHVIRNLRTHIQNPVTILYSRYSSSNARMTLKNIDFINLILDEYLAYAGGTTDSTGVASLIVSGCRFVGKRSHVIFYAGSNGVSLTSCYFNVPCSLTNNVIATVPSDTSKARDAYFCHFRETYGSWEIVDNATSFYNFRMSGCYVEGEIVGGQTINISSQYSNDSIVQNVIDADIKTIAPEGSTITVYAPKGVWRDDIHSTDTTITGTYQYINGNDTLAIPETPQDMINTTKLYNDGFDVIH